MSSEFGSCHSFGSRVGYCGYGGTSIRGKTGVSKFANNELKKVLHMAAISSVQHNPDLHQYYQRKVQEGKNKMSVINAVRNKLLHRIVAVVKRGTPYKADLKK